MHSLFIFVAFVTIGYATCAVQCPTNLPKDSNLIVNGSKCYEFVLHHRHDWAYAAGDCTKKGGNLVTVSNMAEQNFIMNSLKHLRFIGKGVWIGLNDKQKEGHFQWVEGNQPANFTYWASGQPGSFFGLNEDCVLLMYHRGGHWHDYHCFDEFLSIPEHDGWVCQYVLKQATNISPIVPSSTNPTSQKATTMMATTPTEKVTTMAVTTPSTEKITTMAATTPTEKVTTMAATTPSTEKVQTMAATTPSTMVANTNQPMSTGGTTPAAETTTTFVIG